MKKQTLLISFLVLILCSCQKEISKEASNTDANAQVDVYVAGFVDNYRHDYPYPLALSGEYPSYWKNGSLVKLDNDLPNDDGVGYLGGRALSIAVAGTDVYVSGTGLFSGGIRWGIGGLFWENGIRDFPYGSSKLTSLKVSNNDLYMVGSRTNIYGTGEPATYYKNGDPVDILDGSAGSDATSIAVSGNDVYVAGVSITGRDYNYNGSQKLIAKYWKNGNPVNLTDGSKNAYTTSIAVSGTDVYVAGYESDNGSINVAKYWKNVTPVKLTDGLTRGEANSIAVSENDVYVAGTQWDGNINHDSGGNEYRNPIAKYWKNGKPVSLTDGSKWAEAKSIAVSGTDVYVAGFEDGVAKYWKNGSPVILGDVSKYSEAYSIFLVKR